MKRITSATVVHKRRGRREAANGGLNVGGEMTDPVVGETTTLSLWLLGRPFQMRAAYDIPRKCS